MDQKKQHTRDLLRRWIQGDVTAKEEAELRSAARNDEFLRDSMAGYDAFAEQDHDAAVQRLRKRMGQQKSGKVRALVVWRAAAAVALLLVAGYWLYPTLEDQAASATTIASDQRENAEESPVVVPPAQPAAPARSDDEIQEEGELSSSGAVAADDSPPTESAGDSQLFSETVEIAANEPIVTIDLTTSAQAVDFTAIAEETGPEDAAADLAVSEKLAAQTETEPARDEAIGYAAPSPPPPPPATAVEPQPTARQNQGYPSRITKDRLRTTNAGFPIPAEGFKVVEGRIFDLTGEPLIGASVLEQGSANGTVTDIDGFYRIAVDEEDAVLTVSYTGYETQDVAIDDQTKLDVVLEEGVALDEVVVTGLGAKRIDETEEKLQPYAAPVDGFRDLRRYITENTPANTPRTRIRLQFIIQRNGQLSDFEVLRSTDDSLNDLAIDLLKNGPRWFVKQGEAPLMVKYTVTLRN